MSCEDKVKEIVAIVFKVEQGQIGEETDFIEDLNAKSYDIAELIALLEDEFQIEIDPLRARQNKNVGQTIDYINELLSKKSGGST
jgi:acyl carrier protein